MKVKYFKIIIILVILSSFLISGCSKKDNIVDEPDDPKEELSPILNLKVDINYSTDFNEFNYELSFDEVNNSCYYNIIINDHVFEVSENVVNIDRYIGDKREIKISVESYNSSDKANSLVSELIYNRYNIPSGLDFNLLGDGTYEIDVSNCEESQISGKISLPDYYNGILITRLANGSFKRDYYVSAGLGMIKYDHGNLSTTLVKLPNYLTHIDEYAFYDCDKLTNVIFPDSLKYIGDYAFSSCGEIDFDSFPNEIEYIGTKAFHYSNISSFKYSDKLSFVGEYAFHFTPYYSSLEEGYIFYNNVLYSYNGDCPEILDFNTFDRDVSVISGSAFFRQKNLKKVVLSDSVNYIGNRAFAGCQNIDRFDFGQNTNVTYIGEMAFSGCYGITEIEIPSSMTEIGGAAFYGMRITKIVIPENIEKINDHAFNCCTSLEEVVFMGNPKYVSGFDFCTSLKEFTIPSSCIEIGEEAFKDCKSLTKINLNEGLLYIGQGAFANTAIKDIKLPSSLLKLGNLGYKIDSNGLMSPNSTSVFLNVSLDYLYIPNNVCTLGNDLFFYNVSIKNIVMPKSVREISSNTFIAYQLHQFDKYAANAIKIYYEGAPSDFDLINVCFITNTEIINKQVKEFFEGRTLGNMYYYSENTPIDNNYNYWHYVDGVPTIWS